MAPVNQFDQFGQGMRWILYDFMKCHCHVIAIYCRIVPVNSLALRMEDMQQSVSRSRAVLEASNGKSCRT